MRRIRLWQMWFTLHIYVHTFGTTVMGGRNASTHWVWWASRPVWRPVRPCRVSVSGPPGPAHSSLPKSRPDICIGTGSSGPGSDIRRRSGMGCPSTRFCPRILSGPASWCVPRRNCEQSLLLPMPLLQVTCTNYAPTTKWLNVRLSTFPIDIT